MAENAEQFHFEAEISRLLQMIIHSVYSEREVFLRELISNAADACDKLRHAAVTQPELDAPQFAIDLSVDPAARTLTIADNGIGMDRAELIDNLGTIARSGTARFLEGVAGGEGPQLIGRFGIGFYSAFMAADRVEVTSRKAGAEAAWTWISEGAAGYRLVEAAKPAPGTAITLYLKADAGEFLEPERLAAIVDRHCRHIAFPVRLIVGDGAIRPLGGGSALWTRAKSAISDDEYREFYHHVAGGFDDPALTLHFHAEGRLDYRALLFIPGKAPYDLYDPARQARVKLYVKRVLITDDCSSLVPGWARFLKGVVDAEDLELNLSREMLQHDPRLGAMRKAISSRLLAELAKCAKDQPQRYDAIWREFGRVLKEGLYEAPDRRAELIELARFSSTMAEGSTSLADYVARMPAGQQAIYVLRGDHLDAAKASPQLEGFAAKGFEVLLLVDPIDEFWVDAVGDYQGKPLRSVTKAGDEAELRGEPGGDAGSAPLIAALKTALGGLVADVRASQRLTSSAVCLVAAADGPDLHLEKLLRRHDEKHDAAPRILEINPGHPLIQALAAKAGTPEHAADIALAAQLLLDQARISEGEGPSDPAGFARRLGEVMIRLF